MEEDLNSGLQRTYPAIAVSRARLEHGAKSPAFKIQPLVHAASTVKTTLLLLHHYRFVI